MVPVLGPDGHSYNVNFARNVKLEQILEICTGRKISVFEGYFPWIRKAVIGGYNVHLASGWKKYSTAVRAGFQIGHIAYLHSDLPLEEKVAIALHELVHIIENHPEGHDLATERATTSFAIHLAQKMRAQAAMMKINVGKVIIALERRQQIYEREGI
jgi:hypothetical protein